VDSEALEVVAAAAEVMEVVTAAEVEKLQLLKSLIMVDHLEIMEVVDILPVEDTHPAEDGLVITIKVGLETVIRDIRAAAIKEDGRVIRDIQADK